MLFRCLIPLVCLAVPLPAAPIERLWLSHATTEPSRLVINWETAAPGDSVVEYGPTEALGQTVTQSESVTLHHVEIPMGPPDSVQYYRVRSGGETSAIARCKTRPSRELRIAVVGDWAYAKADDLSALLRDDPHLLLSAGDNVASLHERGREGTRAFSALIDRQPALFRSVPFLPILGNHDRELTPRGPKPPAHAVYDVEARAYREFFALPGDEWKWHFDLPDFDLRLIALDLNHIQDHGTTWQTCHAYDAESPQYRWYRARLDDTRAGFVVTLNNEKQTSLLGRTRGLWHEQFGRGSALITGFGYFAERAELPGGLPYFNTCLKGDGDPYKDPQSKFFAREHNYLLLTLRAGEPVLRVAIKALDGRELDVHTIGRRPQ